MTPIPFGEIVPIGQAEMVQSGADLLNISLVAGMLLLIVGLSVAGEVLPRVLSFFLRDRSDANDRRNYNGGWKYM